MYQDISAPTVEEGEAKAWTRSVPVERADGVRLVGEHILASLRRVHPGLRVVYDGARKVSVLWIERAADIRYCICDNPFHPDIDERLVEYMRKCDTRSKSLKDMAISQMAAKAKVKKRDVAKVWNSIDHGRMGAAMMKMASAIQGATVRPAVQVPLGPGAEA